MHDISKMLSSIMQHKECSSMYALFLLDKEDANVPTVSTAEIHTDEQRDNLGSRSRGSESISVDAEQQHDSVRQRK